MVTYEEMKKVMENAEKERKQASYNVTPEEMQRFKGNDKLPYIIATKKEKMMKNMAFLLLLDMILLPKCVP